MAKRKTSKEIAKTPARAKKGRGLKASANHAPGLDDMTSRKSETGPDLLSGAGQLTPRPLSDWIVDAYDMMTEDRRLFFHDMPGVWDELTINEKQNPADGEILRALIGKAIRSGVWNLVGWAMDAPLPEVKKWAGSLLADVVMCLETSGYVKATGIKKQSADFQARWDQLKKDGRGGSDLAVVPVFADLVMHHAEHLLEHIMQTAKDGVIDLPSIASKAERELWRFVSHIQKMMDATGQRFKEPDFVRRAFDVLLCSHKTEEKVLDSILMPLAAALWPQFIKEPGQIEFTGIGRFRFGRPLSSRVNKSKHGKPITDFSTLKEQIKPAIRRKMRFRRLLGHDSIVPLCKHDPPTKTKM